MRNYRNPETRMSKLASSQKQEIKTIGCDIKMGIQYQVTHELLK